jgi:predicted TIM-barrel fold metal-dependent hydrolase
MDAMDYKLISCDDHLDLNQLPADVWTARVPVEYRDRAPHVEERDGRMVWVCDGQVWGSWSGKMPDPNKPKAPPPLFTAFVRAGIENEGQRRPAVPELRLEDMDRDGVHSHVIFGPVTSIKSDDVAFRDACYSAYNDWLAEFCAVAPDRLLGVPMLPEFPASATEELYRLAKMGLFRQANLQIAAAQPRLNDAAWEPFWTALEETGIVLSFHITVFAPRPGDPGVGKPAGTFTATKAFIEQFLDPFIDLFAWGILERHPKMKLVMAESGLGWLPWVVQELDYRHWRLWEAKEFWADKGGIPLVMKPSDLFKRQIYVTFQEDYVAMALLPFYGENNVLWASDYPHPDSIWPHSHATIEKQMASLSPEMRKKLTHDNAARLYRIMEYADGGTTQEAIAAE